MRERLTTGAKQLPFVMGSLLALLALLSSCTLPISFHPLVAHRVWEQKTKGEVFDAVMRAIHNEDFLVAAADKESGMIATDWKLFAAGDFRCQMRVNLLVFEETQGFVAVSFKSVVQYWDRDDRMWVEVLPDQHFNEEGFKRLTMALDDFFLEVQRYVGPSVQRR